MTQAKSQRFGLSESTISAIQAVFKSFPKITKATLYGSRAKGNYRSGSDIDMTLLGGQLEYSDLVVIETALDDLLLPYSIDLSIYYKIENADLLDHIKRVGIVFYEKK